MKNLFGLLLLIYWFNGIYNTHKAFRLGLEGKDFNGRSKKRL